MLNDGGGRYGRLTMSVRNETFTRVEDAVWELPPEPDVRDIVTENDEPVDNIQSEKNQRLLVGALLCSWQGPPARTGIDTEGDRRRFFAAANVGVFDTPKGQPVVPDVLLSTDVSVDELSWAPDARRTYFVWEIGKPPELVVELVSNRRGKELTDKLQRYARMHVSYYVVYDPAQQLGDSVLRGYALSGDRLQPLVVNEPKLRLPSLGLGLGLWTGAFENTRGRWLRFFDDAGIWLETGDEKADRERERAEREQTRAEREQTRAEKAQLDSKREHERAERERERAESAHERAQKAHNDAERERERARAAEQRAERLASRLRELGVDTDD